MSTTTQETWPTLGELLESHLDLTATVFAILATTERHLLLSDLAEMAQKRAPHLAIDEEDVRKVIVAGVASKLLKYSAWRETSLITFGYDVARHHGGVVGWLRDRAREGAAS